MARGSDHVPDVTLVAMAVCFAYTERSAASVWSHSSQVCSLAGSLHCLGVWNITFLPVLFSQNAEGQEHLHTFWGESSFLGFKFKYCVSSRPVIAEKTSRDLICVEKLDYVSGIKVLTLYSIWHVLIWCNSSEIKMNSLNPKMRLRARASSCAPLEQQKVLWSALCLTVCYNDGQDECARAEILLLQLAYGLYFLP